MNIEQLVEILRVYAVVTEKNNLEKLLGNELTLIQYLKNMLVLQTNKLPYYEAEVKKEESKMNNCKDSDLSHRTEMLKLSKEHLLEIQQNIRRIRKELHKMENKE